MNTRKYPRTLNEAFGPYTNREFVERKRPFDWQDRVVMWASSIIGFILLALLTFKVIV